MENLRCENDELWLALEEEYTDFLWFMVRPCRGEFGEVSDGHKIPSCLVDDMTRSLFGM
jgi:hypothetical protein